MSDIERVTIWAGGMLPANNDYYVRYDDHRAEVERVMADVVKLRIDLNSAQVAANQRRGEVERLTHERDEALAEVERLKEQVAALTVAVEQADEMKAHAEAAAAMEEAETDRVMAERDAARAEVERLKAGELNGRRATNQRIIAERDAAQAEVERLRANGQAILDRSRPTDEDIWREAFMLQLHDDHVPNWATTADLALAEYRKRWPR